MTVHGLPTKLIIVYAHFLIATDTINKYNAHQGWCLSLHNQSNLEENLLLLPMLVPPLCYLADNLLSSSVFCRTKKTNTMQSVHTAVSYVMGFSMECTQPQIVSKIFILQKLV